MFRLLQGERDRGAQEFERHALGGGGYCEQVEAASSWPTACRGVAGQRGEVVKQGGEAGGGWVGGGLGRGLGVGALGAYETSASTRAEPSAPA